MTDESHLTLKVDQARVKSNQAMSYWCKLGANRTVGCEVTGGRGMVESGTTERQANLIYLDHGRPDSTPSGNAVLNLFVSYSCWQCPVSQNFTI